VRIRVCAYVRWCGWYGETIRCAVKRIGIRAGTVYAWRTRWRRDRLRARKRGRRPVRGSVIDRNIAIDYCVQWGSHVSVDRVWRHVGPWISRQETRKLVRRFRRLVRKRESWLATRLSWDKPGHVWGIDFTTMPRPIAGWGRTVMVVWVLGQRGGLIAAEPVRGESAAEAWRVLAPLLRRRWWLLAIKCDNGSAFIACELREHLEAWGIELLYSPPRSPEYNGAYESGIGWLKKDAAWSAKRGRRKEVWSEKDLEYAVDCACKRAYGCFGDEKPDPWDLRADEDVILRKRFAHALARRRFDVAKELFEDTPYAKLQRNQRAQVDRKAIPYTLEQIGLLSYTRRRITPPF